MAEQENLRKQLENLNMVMNMPGHDKVVQNTFGIDISPYKLDDGKVSLAETLEIFGLIYGNASAKGYFEIAAPAVLEQSRELARNDLGDLYENFETLDTAQQDAILTIIAMTEQQKQDLMVRIHNGDVKIDLPETLENMPIITPETQDLEHKEGSLWLRNPITGEAFALHADTGQYTLALTLDAPDFPVKIPDAVL